MIIHVPMNGRFGIIRNKFIEINVYIKRQGRLYTYRGMSFDL